MCPSAVLHHWLPRAGTTLPPHADTRLPHASNAALGLLPLPTTPNLCETLRPTKNKTPRLTTNYIPLALHNRACGRARPETQPSNGRLLLHTQSVAALLCRGASDPIIHKISAQSAISRCYRAAKRHDCDCCSGCCDERASLRQRWTPHSWPLAVSRQNARVPQTGRAGACPAQRGRRPRREHGRGHDARRVRVRRLLMRHHVALAPLAAAAAAPLPPSCS